MVLISHKIKMFISVTVFLIPLFLHQEAESSTAGPLFIQVHFTSVVSNITSVQAEQILDGKISNFRELGGENIPIKIYAEKKISSYLRKEYPRLKYAESDYFRAAEYSSKSFIPNF